MESIFYGLNNENMKIEYDKDFERVMNKLQTNFGWSNIDILPDSYKDLLNDTIKAVKNCSIPTVVAQSELVVCDICKLPYTKEEKQVGHCFNCGEQKAFNDPELKIIDVI